MKVKELVQKLNQLDPELDVLCYSEDSGLLASKHLFRLLDIHEISVIEGQKTKGDDQVPSLKIGHTPFSQRHAVIEVTSDF